MNVYLRKAIEGGFKLSVAKSLKNATFLLEDKKFDVILLDLNLPDSKGADTVHHISPFAKNIPVVVCSGDDTEKTRENCLRAGADEVLCKKEINPKLLLDKISFVVENYRRDRISAFMFAHNFS